MRENGLIQKLNNVVPNTIALINAVSSHSPFSISHDNLVPSIEISLVSNFKSKDLLCFPNVLSKRSTWFCGLLPPGQFDFELEAALGLSEWSLKLLINLPYCGVIGGSFLSCTFRWAFSVLCWRFGFSIKLNEMLNVRGLYWVCFKRFTFVSSFQSSCASITLDLVGSEL